ncbi:MAG: hypothetical protein KAJ07_05915 [Planctomycetes bacterium]|nr:hypothetical protein [Planctomycetota bacterium]
MIRKISLLLFVCAVVLATTGCSSINISEEYALDELSGKGVVILSTTETGNHWSPITSLLFRKVGSNRSTSIMMWHRDFLDSEGSMDMVWFGWFGDMIPEDKSVGLLNALELPAGEYEFHTYRSNASAPGVVVSFTIPKDFSWKFTVESGVAKYLGNINYHFFDRKTFLDHLITFNDDRSRDLRLAGQKYPNISIDDIKIELLKKSPGDAMPRDD